MIRTVHLAKYVLAEAGSLLRNAAVHVAETGRISRVEPWKGPSRSFGGRVVDWGSAILLPGLVNAHTHLELTGIPVKCAGTASFADWLSQVVAARRALTQNQFLANVRQGAALSLASGTTLLGEVSTGGWSCQALKSEPFRKVVFEEAISLDPATCVDVRQALESRLSRTVADDLLGSGVSPHAPYTVSPELYQAAADIARTRELRLMTHVAETEQELEFLKSGGGPLGAFLAGLGALPPDWKAPGLEPVRYLDGLGVLDSSSILVHCNHLDDGALALILGRGCSVIYCPRSQACFSEQPHPVRQLLDSEVNVALGTDSMASSDSLSILDEMRFLYRRRRDLRCDEIIRMATLNGAVALDFGGVLGRLRRGYWADLTVLSLPVEMNDRNVEAQLLEGAGECVATIVRGSIAWADAQATRHGAEM
jgi:cytosine/adenosine deaminase-related metal-dependent hydrolase